MALWAVFAAAAVGVGFGAAGLVGDPFTDGVGEAAVTDLSAGATPEPADSAGTALPGSSPTSATGSPSGRPTGDPDRGGPTGGTDRPAPSGSSPGTTASGSTTRPTASGTRPAGARTVTRTLATRAGIVSARCRLGLVRLGASPAVGWTIKDIDGGPRRVARVRFEEVAEDGSRVEVRAGCVLGRPRFVLDDDPGDEDETSGGGGGDDSSEG